jgi:hypothetical protein
MIFSWDMAERLQCSEKEKKDAVEVISDIVAASEKARRMGLLALEEDIEGYRKPLLRLGMNMVVDGMDPKIIREILEARILSENKKGKDLLEQVLIYQGCLAIQAGENPGVVTTHLFAFLGEEGDRFKDEYFQNVVAVRQREELEQFINGRSSVPGVPSELRDILGYSDMGIQKILREIDMYELGKVLIGADSDVRRKVIQNMSEKTAFLLVEEIHQILGDEKEIREACKNFWKIIGKLKEHGEI